MKKVRHSSVTVTGPVSVDAGTTFVVTAHGLDDSQPCDWRIRGGYVTGGYPIAGVASLTWREDLLGPCTLTVEQPQGVPLGSVTVQVT